MLECAGGRAQGARERLSEEGAYGPSQDLKCEKQSTSPELVAERMFQGEGRASVSCEKGNSRQKAVCLEQGGMGRERECGSGGRGEAGRAGHRSQVTGPPRPDQGAVCGFYHLLLPWRRNTRLIKVM